MESMDPWVYPRLCLRPPDALTCALIWLTQIFTSFRQWYKEEDEATRERKRKKKREKKYMLSMYARNDAQSLIRNHSHSARNTIICDRYWSFSMTISTMKIYLRLLEAFYRTKSAQIDCLHMFFPTNMPQE